MKRGPQDDDLMKSGKNPKVAYDYVFKVLAQNTYVGAILGKSGATINQLHAETGCEISAARKDDCFPNTKYRIVHVSADSKEKLQNGIARIAGLLPELAKTATNPEVKSECMGKNENEVRLRFLLPKNACGQIIGKKGDVIKELRARTGATFDVDREAANYGPVPESVAEVIGELHQIAEVINAVTDTLEVEKDNAWYQKWASHKDCRSLGTAVAEPRGRNDNRRRDDYRDEDRRGDRHPDVRRGDRRERRREDEFEHERRGDRHHEDRQSASRREKRTHNPASVLKEEIDRMNESPDLGMEVSVNTRIPSEFAGCIIGAGGHVIKRLKDSSGAYIKVHEGNGETLGRDVELKGGPLEVCAALLMCWNRLSEKAAAQTAEANEEAIIKAQMYALEKQLESVRERGARP